MLTDRRTDGRTEGQTDRRTSSIHKPELLCNPANKTKNSHIHEHVACIIMYMYIKGETITHVNGNILFFAGKRLENF